MTTEELRDGMVLELTRDVTNPKPDRRAKHDWTKRAVIPKGFRLIAREQTYQAEAVRNTDGTPVIWKWFMLSRPSGYFVTLHDPLYFFLLSTAQPVEKNLKEIMNEYGVEAWGYEVIVDALLANGRITLGDVRKILAAFVMTSS